MNGNIPVEMWNEIRDDFLILPEDKWQRRFVLWIQELGWSLEKTNAFIAWVALPPKNAPINIFEYMKSSALEYEKNIEQMPSIHIHINTKINHTKLIVSYEEICHRAGCKGQPTITWMDKKTNRSGTLCKDEWILVSSETRFDVVHIG